MTGRLRADGRVMPPEFGRVPARRILIVSPTIHFRLGPGDRVLVSPGQKVNAGAPIVERTPDPEYYDVGRLKGMDRYGNGNGSGGRAVGGADAPAGVSSGGTQQERRRPPEPGKWWVGGDDRRGKDSRHETQRRIAGTLLYELDGRWSAAVGERHEKVESPTTGVVTAAVNCIGISMKVTGVAIPAAVAGGQPTRGYLDVPRLVDGELRDTALDVSRSGAIVVAGGRVSAEALSRARAMSIRGMVAGSLGEGELRDLAASEVRQSAGLHLMPPFGVLGLDGHQRRPIASPILALLAALAGREAAVVIDPPLLVVDVMDVPLPDVAPDWVRVRSGPHAGREGRWLSSAGLHRFRAGIHLEAANVRLGDDLQPTIIALADLERFIL
ncbi:MAG: hypothetical protein ABSA21_07935 [Candidatus Limnocylindrales bacterium]